jgi:3-hydroxyisobutyrate dehydrogenase
MTSSNYTVTVLGLGAMGLPMATRLATELTVHGFRHRRTPPGARRSGRHQDLRLSPRSIPGRRRAAPRRPQRRTARRCPLRRERRGLGSQAGRRRDPWQHRRHRSDPGHGRPLAEYGVSLVDAPLSGGPKRAGEGDLLIVVGAEPEALEKARPALELLASTLSIVGDKPGDGQALKTVNQLLCGVHIAAAAEAMALADALGLDQAKTLAALEAGAAGSFMLSNRGPRILEAYNEDGAEVLSRLDIFVKDMGIVGKATRAAGLAAPVAAAAEQLYLLGQAQGLAAADDSAVIKVVAPAKRTV